MKLIVGLGNPEKKYQYTRHNFGFLVLEQISQNWTEKKQLFCQINKTEKRLLCRPLTYMNSSGQAVKAVCSYYKIATNDVIVVHDDLDLPFGQIKTGIFSGSAGHNGIKSIQEAIGKNFIRVRLGIGKPQKPQQDIASYVLENFSNSELKCLNKQLDLAVEIITDLLTQDLNKVQNKFNKKTSE